MKKPSAASLKKKIDAVFSEWVRRKGADANGNNRCVCCGATHHWKELQAGHYFRRQYINTRWDERNVWPCCFACNVWRRGNYAMYAQFMYKTLGQPVVDELEALHRTQVKLYYSDYLELLNRYKGLLAQLNGGV